MIARKSLRLEKEAEENGDEENEPPTFKQATESKMMMRGRVTEWFADRGFGFVMIQGRKIFVHARAV